MKAINKWLIWLLCAGIALALAGCSDDNKGGGGEPPPPTVIVPEEYDQVVIYEAYPGMFGTSNTLNAITGRLDNIRALGVNVLWLMPVFEQGVKDAFGSPYCVRDFRKINPSYGTTADLKVLVTAAHAKGMRVILDIVPNHTSWDNAWITEHPDWYTKDAGGNIISPPGFNWTDVADLNFGNTELRAEMINVLKYWITEVDVDGYRCDYADGVPTDFWSDAIAALKALKGDDLLMLAESSDVAMAAAGFDMLYGWAFASTLQAVYRGSQKVSALYSTNASEYQGLGEGQHRMRFITNHDMNSETATASFYNTDRGSISAYVIAATMGGCPMIYGSQEIAYPGTISFFRNFTVDWTANADYRTEYQKIMEARASSTALQASGQITAYNVDDYVACYKRSDGAEDVLVTVNTSANTKTVTVPAEFALSKVKDLMSGSTFTTTTTLSLDAYDYAIWKLED